MQIIRPLQQSFNCRVLEQDRKFYFIASATLGVNLGSGEALLEFDFFKDAFECMGASPLPDTGMPKPHGEVLVSGKCFAPGGKAVRAHEVGIKVGEFNKSLYVFGDRFWKRAGGLVKVITDPEPFTEMEIVYPNAFGGEGFDKNPQGKGLPIKTETGETIQPLPNIEDPKKLIGSPDDRPDPASFGPLDLSRPQRMRFAGTYGDDYKEKYFPGYPRNLDWHHFLCAPRNQWIKGFFSGDEPFEILNMHPENPVIAGTLPGLYARCFIRHTIKSDTPEFEELAMNLDTIWFLPEKMLALLIFRKGIEVGDDEAEQITHVMGAYEDRADEPRTLEHYQKALEKRMSSDDALLKNLNTTDLIPAGALCAMELLMEKAFSDDGEESELTKNINAKADSMEKMSDEKIEGAIDDAQKHMESDNIPDEGRDLIPDEGKLDLRKMIKEQPEPAPDPAIEDMKLKIDAIIPGLMAGDPKKIDFKEFSFDKIGQVMDVVDEFADKKQKEGMEQAKTEIAKIKDKLKQQIERIEQGQPEMPGESKEKLAQTLKTLEDVDVEADSGAPLPRLDAEEIKAQMPSSSPEMLDAMMHLEAMKNAGFEDEQSQELQKQIQQSKQTMEEAIKESEEGLVKAEKAFKEGYLMGAHLMNDGLSPHKEPVEKVKERFLKTISEGGEVANGDWACIDLSGQNLDGVDLSGAFLEQVNFTGASLKDANLTKAILARADLTDADLTNANLTEANVGGVNARRTNFTYANMNCAQLTKGDFTDADFTRALLEDIEALKITVDGANFTQAIMPTMKFIESDITGAKFPQADLSSTFFVDCDIKDADFSEATMPGCAFANARLTNVCFDKADLAGVCFVASDPEKAAMKNLQFRGANLKQSNFQDMVMQGADFSDANLENSNFGGADLSDAVLSGAYAKSAQFRKALLGSAKLNNINLMEGSLAKAYLVDASFVGANLYAVDFLRSTIKRTDFRGCNLDSTLIEHWRPE